MIIYSFVFFCLELFFRVLVVAQNIKNYMFIGNLMNHFSLFSKFFLNMKKTKKNSSKDGI